jgi:hypothetical protein
LLNNNGQDGENQGNPEQVDDYIHTVVYNNFRDSNKHMLSGMVLGMYRILGVAAFLIGMTAAMQKYEDYEIYLPLRGVNMYSILLPIFSVLYDAQLPQILGRYELKFNVYFKYVFIMFYWVFMAFVTITVLQQPYKNVIVYKKVLKDK